MKKLLTVLLIAFMTLSLAGCEMLKLDDEQPATDNDKPSTETRTSDYSQWKTADMVNYLKEKGVFTNEEWIYVSDSLEIGGTGITEMVSYMDDEGTIMGIIIYIDPESSDPLTQAHLKTLQEEQSIKMENLVIEADKVVGTVLVRYSDSIDETFYENMKAALAELN